MPAVCQPADFQKLLPYIIPFLNNVAFPINFKNVDGVKAIEKGNEIKAEDIVFLDVVKMNEESTSYGFGGIFVLLIIICMISLAIISTFLLSKLLSKGDSKKSK